ncbi:hypothetical protein K440DRAFT_615528 [Wilcoxina mikolae CBS 423.85]|nr:hypothetical protein K440DRAFT_615528 [Wilcoxina mikolae CBS 423.85]
MPLAPIPTSALDPPAPPDPYDALQASPTPSVHSPLYLASVYIPIPHPSSFHIPRE